MINCFTVRLRCGLIARVHELAPDLQVHLESSIFATTPLETLFIFQGMDAEGWPHLWRFDGRWREDGSDSPFDIVAQNIVGLPGGNEP